MEKSNVDNKKYLYGIFIIEFIISLSLNLFYLGNILRIVGIIVAIVGAILYLKEFKKINTITIIFLVVCLLYGLSLIPYLSTHYEWLDSISLILSFLSAGIIGYTVAEQDKIQTSLTTIFGCLVVFGIISLFCSFFAYSFFYSILSNASSIPHSSKMIIIPFSPFEKEMKVELTFFGYALTLMTSGLMLFWRHKKVDESETRLQKVVLASGIIGVVGLITIPYLLGIAINVLAIGITMLIMYFPKSKAKRIIVYSGLGVGIVLAIIVVILKGQDIVRIKVMLDVLSNVFKYPLGGQPVTVLQGTANTRNIFVDSLYQNGFPAFFLLLGLMGISIYTLLKYYKSSDDSKMIKDIILSFMIHYFVYVNLNYHQKVFGEYTDALPLFADPTLLINMVLVGYMMNKNIKTTLKNKSL